MSQHRTAVSSRPGPGWTRTYRIGRIVLAAAVGALVLVAAPSPAAADEATLKGRQGMMWARWKKCDKAIPLLEQAELLRHRAHIALALADCYAESGKLIEAVEIYRALANEEITRRHFFVDRVAIKKAKKRLEEAEARIPTLAFELPPDPYEGLEIFVDGEPVDDPTEPRVVKPGETLVIIARAEGYEELRDEVTLAEGEHLVRPLSLTKIAPQERSKPKKRPKKESAGDGVWFGMRGRAYVIPTFVWRVFGDGGRTVFAPGGSLTLTHESDDADLMLTLGYTSYGLGPTPFKPKDAPDTDWEIIESDLHAGYFTAELVWRDPLNDMGTWEFYWGVGAGIGWTFAGDITRTQAYPFNLRPGDPYAYKKCRGPNDPPGSYLYCNQLDHDANHYDYAEPDWFHGGKRPLVYPWLAFPQVGLTHKTSAATAIDLELGLTTGGLLIGLGVRGR